MFVFNCFDEFIIMEFDEEICVYYVNEDDYFEMLLEILLGGFIYIY